MTTVSQEAELILRARDLSSQPLQAVADKVKALSDALAQQNNAARTGGTGLKELNQNAADLDRAMTALLATQVKIERLGSVSEKLFPARDKVQEAQQAFDQYAATLDTSKRKTEEQATELRRLKEALDAAKGDVRPLEREYKSLGDALKRVGVDITSLADASTVANNALRSGINALAATDPAKEQIRAFAELAAVRERARAQEDSDRTAQLAQYNFEQRINAQRIADVDKRRAAEAKAAAERTAQFEKARQEAEQFNAFRNLASDATSRLGSVTSFGNAPGLRQFSGVSDEITKLIAPAAAARSTLQGLEEEVGNITRAFGGGEKTVERYAQELDALRRSQDELRRQAGLVDSFQRQEAATKAAYQQVIQHRAELQRLDGQIKRTTEIDRDLIAAVNAEKQALASAASEYERNNQRLTELGASLSRAGLNTRNLAEDTARLRAVGLSSAETFKLVGAELERVSGRGGAVGFLGLRPYELTNLSFQVNDVFTQLASGTSLTQTAAQQGGQIFQLFQERLIGAAGAARAGIPAYISTRAILSGLAVTVVGLTGFFLALARGISEAAAERGFEARLRATVDSTQATAQQLEAISKSIVAVGASSSEAREAVRLFLDEGINVARISELGVVSQKIVDIWGGSLKEVAKEVANGFDGTQASIDRLNEKYKFLDATTRELIDQQLKNGDTTKALDTAFAALSSSIERGVAVAVSPAAQAFRNLRIAYNSFLDALANSAVIQGVINKLSELLGLIARAIAVSGGADRLDGASGADREARASKLRDIEGERVGLARELAGLQGKADFLSATRAAALQRQLDDLKVRSNEIRALDLKNAPRTDPNAAPLPGINTGSPESRRTAGEQFRESLERESPRTSVLLTPQRIARDEAELRRYRQELEDRARKTGVGADPNAAENKAAIDALVARKRQEQEIERASMKTLEQLRADDKAATDKILAGNLQGARGAALGRQAIDEEIDKKRRDRANATGLSLAEVDKQFGEEFNAQRQALYAKDAESRRKFDESAAKSGAGAAEKRLNAEEGLAAKLLALRAKIDGADKTNLEAVRRGIEERYAAYDILIAKAERAGAASLPSGFGSIADFRNQVETLKQQEIQTATLTALEEGLKKKLDERKEAYSAINEQLASGAITASEAFDRTQEVTSRLTPALRNLATEAAAFARDLGGADPSPKVAAAIARFERFSNRPDTAKGESNGEELAKTAFDRVARQSAALREIESAERDLFAKRGQTASQMNDNIEAAYKRLTPEIAKQTAELQGTINKMYELGQISPETFQLMSAKLKGLQVDTRYVSDGLKLFYKTLEDSFGTRATQFLDTVLGKLGEFSNGTATLRDVFATVGSAFSAMTAGILQDIAKMILRTLILKAIQAVGNAISPGAGTAAAQIGGLATGSVSAPVKHTGGVVGFNDNVRRTGLNPALFANAPRFHSGTIVGLEPNEQAAILEKGEEVLAKGDMRNAMNGGLSKGKSDATSNTPNIRQVLVFDKAQLSEALAGSHGEKVVMTHLKNNTSGIKQLLR